MSELLQEIEKTIREIDHVIHYLHKHGCADRLKWRTESPDEIDAISTKYMSEEELLKADKEFVADQIRELLALRKETILKYRWVTGTYWKSETNGLDDEDIIRIISSGNGDSLGYSK